MDKFRNIIFTLGALLMSTHAYGAPVYFDIDYFDTGDNLVGAGVVSVTSDSLASLPSSGTVFVYDEILSFEALINGTNYIWENGATTFGANDGLLTGITGIAAYSDTGDYLSMATSGGYPIFWTLNGVSQGNYSIPQVSSIPVPAAVWLFGSGLIGLVSFAKRK